MGIDPISLALGGASIMTTFMSMQKQRQAAIAQAQGAAASAAAQIAEVRRQAQEVQKDQQEQKSDRAMAADKEIAAMLNRMSEGGALGSINAARAAQERGFIEGVDLARISGNAKRKAQALKSQEKKIRGDTGRQIDGVLASAPGPLEFAGAALQIGASLNDQRVTEKQARNEV